LSIEGNKRFSGNEIDKILTITLTTTNICKLSSYYIHYLPTIINNYQKPLSIAHN